MNGPGPFHTFITTLSAYTFSINGTPIVTAPVNVSNRRHLHTGTPTSGEMTPARHKHQSRSLFYVNCTYDSPFVFRAI